jgi:site-specific DNA recombinase
MIPKNESGNIIALRPKRSGRKGQSSVERAATGLAAIYVRVSTTDQGERYSPVTQKRRLLEKAGREGKQVLEAYIFEDRVSGKTESRPAFDRLRELVKTGAIDAVYVFDVSRFARKTLDALKVHAEFRRYGVLLDFCEMPFEDSPVGRFTFTQMAAVAEFMGEKILADSQRGTLQKLQEGRLTHGSAPFGYRYVNKRDPKNPSTFEIDEDRAPIVREIFQHRGIDNWAVYRIVAELNNRSVPTVKGGSWNSVTIYQMLANPTYIGQHVRQGIVVPCPAIIAPKLFWACQEVKKESRRKNTGRPTTRHLLSGHLWCARCGHRCSTLQDGKSYRAYRCHNLTSNRPPIIRHCPAPCVKAAGIEDVVWSAIWRLLKDPALLLKMAEAHYKAIKPREGNSVEALQKEADRLQARIQRTQRMIRDGILEYDDGAASIKTDKQRLDQIDGELRRVGRVIQLPTLAQAEAAVAEIVSGSEPSTFEERRHVLDGIQDLKMFCDQDFVEIHGKIPALRKSIHGIAQQVEKDLT